MKLLNKKICDYFFEKKLKLEIRAFKLYQKYRFEILEGSFLY